MMSIACACDVSDICFDNTYIFNNSDVNASIMEGCAKVSEVKYETFVEYFVSSLQKIIPIDNNVVINVKDGSSGGFNLIRRSMVEDGKGCGLCLMEVMFVRKTFKLGQSNVSDVVSMEFPGEFDVNDCRSSGKV